MLERLMTVERLLACSIIFDEAALWHTNLCANELRSLAEHCVQVALAMAGEVKCDA